jgi:hypothetical protein
MTSRSLSPGDPGSDSHLNLDAVPYVFMRMGAGDADGLGDQAVKLGGVESDTEWQPVRILGLFVGPPS